MNVLDNFIPYEYARLIALNDDLAKLGPNTLAVAHRLRAIAARNPRMARFVNRMIRRVG